MNESSDGLDRNNKKYSELKSKLTKRELEIVLFMAESLTYGEIAKSLYIAKSTLRKHTSNIFAKVHVKNKAAFFEKYPDIKLYLRFDDYQLELESKLSRVFDLSWNENNIFEKYYQDFSKVVESMCQLDFSKRLHESGNKNSFLNLIAQGMNIVNSELEDNYIGAEIVPKLLECLNEKNRIVLLSSNSKTITHAISTIGIGVLKTERWIDVPIEEIIELEIYEKINELPFQEYSTVLAGKHFPIYLQGSANVMVEKISNYLLICISTSPENRFSEQMPRILSLLSNIKSQFDDNPTMAQNILGEWVKIEVDSIYKQFEEFLFID